MPPVGPSIFSREEVRLVQRVVLGIYGVALVAALGYSLYVSKTKQDTSIEPTRQVETCYDRNGEEVRLTPLDYRMIESGIVKRPRCVVSYRP